MYILGIETTGPVGSVALYDPQTGQLSMKRTEEPMGHLRRLAEMAQELLTENGISPRELRAVAASVGPGSYTGIRIGVSTARAMAQALSIPAVAVGALDQFRLCCDGIRPVAVIFNARRGQVYGAVFDANGEDILKPGPYMLTEVLDRIREESVRPLFYGDGIDAGRELLTGFDLADKEERYPTAALTVRMAAEKLEAGETVSYQDLLPRYMRETEAEQKLRDGTLARLREAKMAKFRSR